MGSTFLQLLFASSNPHKLDEVRAILEPLGVTVEGLNALGTSLPEPEETESTFEGNARLKAVYYATQLGRICLADDSGLEVDALSGEPGVLSARYAGVGATRAERDEANNRKLLAALARIPQDRRTARFVCAMCLADASGNVIAETRGVFEGVITDQPRGSNGFGYDPLLFLPGDGCTSAELSPEMKNARSHRGAAARAMAEWLAKRAAGRFSA